MENIATVLIPLFLTAIMMKFLFLPIRHGIKLALHALCGFLCLWLLGGTADVTGISLPINAVTVLIAGTLGLPGIGLVALLELAA